MPVKTISIDQVQYDADFRYSRKAKYLSIRLIPHNKIEVVIPAGYNFAIAESFLYQKSDWIKKHIQKQQQPAFMFTGRKIEIEQTFDLFRKKHEIELKGDKLFIKSPANSVLNPEKLFELWLKDQAKKYIPSRAVEIAGKIKISFKSLSIKGQRTRWGSCSAAKNLSFNYRLMKFRKEVIDYVIIHELCHILEMNHSARFWKHVETVCPDYKLLKKELK